MKCLHYFIVLLLTYYVSFCVSNVDGQRSEDSRSSMAAQRRFGSRDIDRRGAETLFKDTMTNFSATMNHVARVVKQLANRLLQLEKYALSSKNID